MVEPLGTHRLILTWGVLKQPLSLTSARVIRPPNKQMQGLIHTREYAREPTVASLSEVFFILYSSPLARRPCIPLPC